MKRLEDVERLWLEDCKIDDTNLIGESARIPELHAKYHSMLCKEALRLKKFKTDYDELVKAKTEYYNGSISEDELIARKWEPNPLKILRQDINIYIQADKDIINLSLRTGVQEQVVRFLEDIVRQINSRNFVIKNMIEWAKFSNGGY